MKTIDRYRATVIAVLLSVALVLASHLIALDLFELVIEWLQRINTRDFHKLIFSFFLILVGFLIDLSANYRRQSHAATLQAQRLHVLKATMRTVHDIVNNFLNNLQLFRMEAEGALSVESQELFDTLIQDTSAKLKVSGDLEEIHEKQAATGSVIDYEG